MKEENAQIALKIVRVVKVLTYARNALQDFF